jgi:hypothetical protein
MKKIALLAAALAFVGYAVATPISFIPATISSPGTYQVTANLVTTSSLPAITINSPKAGKIVLDLGGFTLSAVGVTPTGIEISNPTNSVIVVQNGTAKDFFIGVDANGGTGWISKITISNITVIGARHASISFGQVNNSLVSGCTCLGALPGYAGGPPFGIVDNGSQGGNRYVNDTFDSGPTNGLSIGQPIFPGTFTIDCHVTAP